MQDSVPSSSSDDSALTTSSAQAPATDAQSSTRWRPTPGVVVAVLGGWLAFTVMARSGNWAWSVPVGLVGCLVSVWGILDAIGSFDSLQGGSAPSVRLTQLLPRIGAFVASAVGSVVVLRLSVAATVTAAFGVLSRLGIWNGSDVKLTERHGFWLAVLTTVVYLPMLGSYSLIDPWETHYGEVAREMLARDDWISLWWAQDGWFFSKPVLDFWIQGLSFSALGVRFMPDEIRRGSRARP